MTPAGAWRRVGRCFGAAATLLLATACVTTYEEAPLFGVPGDKTEVPPYAVVQTIPFGETPTTPEEKVLHELYSGVFDRLQQAATDGNVAEVEALLAAYERGALPTWVQARFGGYRSLALGLRFVRHARERGVLALQPGPDADPATDAATDPAAVPVLGQPLEFRYTLPAPSEPVVLGGRMDDDPCGFAVALTVEDAFVDGSTRRYSNQDFVWLPQQHQLTGKQPLTLPVRIDLPAVGAVHRTVHVRIDVMPGYVGIGGLRAAVSRSTLAATSVEQWPEERAEVLAEPLESLRKNLQLGGIAGGRRAYLAALAARGDEREQAFAMLIEEVRCGRGDQSLVAMASLQAMTGNHILVGDRDGWLAWWQARK
ncbi:MAG: hypothetical protein KDC48_12790 [Planctomycetes bacterium]|nr:hypothetical protein [Planctomycetota bacterium]